MKALVTGATGFIGSHVVDKLLTQGIDVRCTVRKSSNIRWLKDKPVELANAELDDIESLKLAMKDIGIVIHVAGLTFARDYNEFLNGNMVGTKNLIEAAYKSNHNLERFLYVSSQTVAGPSPSLENPINENYEPQPLTSYARSKRAAEDVVMQFKDLLPVTIVRPSAVFGPRDTAIYPIFKSVKMGIGTLIGFDQKYLNLIHSDDLSEIIVTASTHPNSIGEIFFAGSKELYTWNRIMDVIAHSFDKKKVIKLKLPHWLVLSMAGLSEFVGKFSSKPPVFNYEKGIDFIQNYWTFTPQKAFDKLGWETKLSIEDAIQDTVDWYIENQWL